MEQHRVIRSASLVGACTALSRVLGLGRDVLMAGLFGTSPAMSAFVTAFRIPNLFRALFGEGALSASFIPVFVESRRREGDARAWELASRIFSLVALALAGLTLLGIGAAELAVRWGAPGEQWTLILRLTQIMLPYMVFICLAAVAMGALNSFHHFLTPAATPMLLNVTLIAAMCLVAPRYAGAPGAQVRVVAWAVLLAGVLQAAAQIPMLRRHGWRARWQPPDNDPRLRRVLALMGPAALGRAVTQVNVMVDTWLAVQVGVWAPAALFYSERLIYLPLGIFATALGTVLLPVFSSQAAADDHAALNRTVGESLRLLLFVMIPAAAGLAFLGRPIIAALFEWRNFTPESTQLTVRALWFYAPGMVAFSLGKVFVPAFYALQDTRTPVRIGVWTVAANIALSIIFMRTWPMYYKHAGIALATVLAETANGVVLARLLHRRLGSPGWGGIARSAARTLLGALLMGSAARACCAGLTEVLRRAGAADKLAQLAALVAAIGVGLLVYVLYAHFTRAPEWDALRAALRRRKKTP